MIIIIIIIITVVVIINIIFFVVIIIIIMANAVWPSVIPRLLVTCHISKDLTEMMWHFYYLKQHIAHSQLSLSLSHSPVNEPIYGSWSF